MTYKWRLEFLRLSALSACHIFAVFVRIVIENVKREFIDSFSALTVFTVALTAVNFTLRVIKEEKAWSSATLMGMCVNEAVRIRWLTAVSETEQQEDDVVAVVAEAAAVAWDAECIFEGSKILILQPEPNEHRSVDIIRA